MIEGPYFASHPESLDTDSRVGSRKGKMPQFPNFKNWLRRWVPGGEKELRHLNHKM